MTSMEGWSGRRFWIEDGTVWPLVGADGAVRGQAAFPRWRDADRGGPAPGCLANRVADDGRAPKGSMKRILFLCGRNRLRSPTAEHVFSAQAGIEAMPAGLDNDADVPCTPELLQWADVVFVMEKAHRSKLASRFKRHLKNTRVICLDIPDNYGFMQPELVQLLHLRVDRHLRRGTGPSLRAP